MRWYSLVSSHSASMRGSFCGRLAFMGKAVLGKFKVLFKSSNLGIRLRGFLSVSTLVACCAAARSSHVAIGHAVPRTNHKWYNGLESKSALALGKPCSKEGGHPF